MANNNQTLGALKLSIDFILSQIEDAPLLSYEDLIHRIGESITELRDMKIEIEQQLKNPALNAKQT